ncbi:hypothetical protein WJX73_005991 [Symbiochloris irregularis]|uniref:Uncharacterized protein n=1 Tax=Symbiochloris irregularis TaxID=706552 RepID=A0AAW1PGJ4_9CHLO
MDLSLHLVDRGAPDDTPASARGFRASVSWRYGAERSRSKGRLVQARAAPEQVVAKVQALQAHREHFRHGMTGAPLRPERHVTPAYHESQGTTNMTELPPRSLPSHTKGPPTSRGSHTSSAQPATGQYQSPFYPSLMRSKAAHPELDGQISSQRPQPEPLRLDLCQLSRGRGAEAQAAVPALQSNGTGAAVDVLVLDSSDISESASDGGESIEAFHSAMSELSGWEVEEDESDMDSEEPLPDADVATASPAPLPPAAPALAGRGSLNLALLPSNAQQGPLSERAVRRAKLKQFERHCSEVGPGLFVAGELVAADREILKAAGITHVINCIGHIFHNPFPEELTYLTLCLNDAIGEDLASLFYLVLDFIEGATKQGGRVLIHCSQGVSRSAALAVAHHMWRTGMPYDEATDAIKALRGVVNPNIGFMCQLLNWQTDRQQGREKTQLWSVVPHSKMHGALLVLRAPNKQMQTALLDPRGAFVLQTPDTLFLWKGREAAASLVAGALAGIAQLQRYEQASTDVQEVQDGEEPLDFEQALQAFIIRSPDCSKGMPCYGECPCLRAQYEVHQTIALSSDDDLLHSEGSLSSDAESVVEGQETPKVTPPSGPPTAVRARPVPLLKLPGSTSALATKAPIQTTSTSRVPTPVTHATVPRGGPSVDLMGDKAPLLPSLPWRPRRSAPPTAPASPPSTGARAGAAARQSGAISLHAAHKRRQQASAKLGAFFPSGSSGRQGTLSHEAHTTRQLVVEESHANVDNGSCVDNGKWLVTPAAAAAASQIGHQEHVRTPRQRPPLLDDLAAIPVYSRPEERRRDAWLEEQAQQLVSSGDRISQLVVMMPPLSPPTKVPTGETWSTISFAEEEPVEEQGRRLKLRRYQNRDPLNTAQSQPHGS